MALDLTDPGFDFSVLSEFRGRLLAGSAEVLLDALLAQCTAHGLLKARGRQRTDSTHVLMAVRTLNRLERVSETLRQALNVLAESVPDWLPAQAPAAWFERYGRRVEEYRLPRGKEERQRYAATAGADGMQLLDAVYAADAPPQARTLPAVQLLRQVWVTEFQVIDGQVQQRAPDNMPPVSERVESPYDPEARFSIKRSTEWRGYKVHVSETCEYDLPALLTHVETTVATEPDVNHLEQIHNALAAKGLPPSEHLVDAGYPRAQSLVSSARDHAITVVGPVYEDRSWQAQAGGGYDLEHFTIDWEQQVVTCPRGRRSMRWCVTRTARQRTMIHIDFAAADCTPYPVRAACTRAKTLPRTLTLQPQAEHEAMITARQRQQTLEFAQQYARRAGIEGTLSQGARECGLRRARYRGLAKTHLQHVATAAGLDISRLWAWRQGVPRARTRRSRFARLAPAS